jgi:hypothetical protein
MDQTVPLKQATIAQLTAFATEVLNISLEPGLKQPQIVARIKAVAPEISDITLPGQPGSPDHDATPDAPKAPAAVGSRPRPGRTRILIQAREDMGGDRPLFVSVNGSGMLIPRGEAVDVPDPYAEVLKNAVEVHYEQKTGDEGEIIYVPRHVPRFPMSIMGPTPATAA